MTEEVKQEEVKAPEPSAIELRAKEMGWRPKEDFNGEEDDFIDAKEFVRRAPLFDKIEHQSKELKNVKNALDALKTHYTKVHETAFNNALIKLKEARQEAITNSDGEAFTTVDAQIKEVERQIQEVKQVERDTTVTPSVNPEFESWVNKNPWYQSSRGMREFADEVGLKFHQQGLTPRDVLRKVEEEVRKEFAHKFRNPNKDSAPDVDPGRQNISKSTSRDSFELSDQEKNIMNTLVRQGVLTKEKYIADLKAAKGMK